MATGGKPSVPTQETSLAGKLVVAAIDFGTTFTGFAYSLRSEPNVINTSKWSGRNVRAATEKAPTCVLFSAEGSVLAFGYEAEEKYALLKEEDREKAKECFFFERFKMKLYQTKKLNRKTKIADVNGKEMLALDIFSKVIGYLKDQLEEKITQACAGLQDDEILWVLTVPAIWSDSAKQFMKEAAVTAGIPQDCIKLVLEPEAGSLYCNTKHLCKIVRVDGSSDIVEFPEGQKYIVADLGGGTADISVHEIIENRNLREIYRSDGGPYGGAMVDMKFQSFLEEVFGEKLIQYITEHSYDDFREIREEFETRKWKFYSKDTEPVMLKIPVAGLQNAAEATGEESIENKIKRAREKLGDTLSLKFGKQLYIPREIFASFFNEAAEGIVKLIENIRKDAEVGEINAMLMVGGFSESEYLRRIIMRDIPGLRIIVPLDPSLAVKGAVISGHNPKIITERIPRYTYGFSFAKPFERDKDPDELKCIERGRENCSSVFYKIITRGDVLKVGDTFLALARRSCTNLYSMLLPLEVELYRSEEKDPKYTAPGYGCELVGLMLLFPPPTGWPPFSLIVQGLVVGESELTVMGIDVSSGMVVVGKLDFLNGEPNDAPIVLNLFEGFGFEEEHE